MSESEDSQFEQRANQEDIFEDNVFQFLNNKDNITELFPVGSFRHKLFLVSSDVDDKMKHGHDVVCDLLNKVKEFQTSLKNRHRKIANGQRYPVFFDLEEQIQSSRTDVVLRVPIYIHNFMKFVKLQPDETFYGKYNYYYTGGCLQHLCVGGKDYLVHIKGKDCDNLSVVPLKNDPTWCIDTAKEVKNVQAGKGEEIFQVLVNKSYSNTLLGVRQKHTCLVYKVMKKKIIECFSINSEVPFISFGLSSVHNELCTINTRQRLSFWDIQQTEVPMAMYFPSDNPKNDKWHNLWYTSDPSVISLATRKSLKWIDRRTNDPSYTVNLIDKFKETGNDEEISIHFASDQNPFLIYVGTNVNLLVIDLRSPKLAVRKWSHYMSSPPLYSCVTSLGEENEIACIANHHPGNVILALNNNSKNYPLVELPTRMETLLSSQSSGLCLDPSIKPRMMSSLTGLTCLKNNKSLNVDILTQTATLDIFSQSLFEMNIDAPNFDDLRSTTEILNAYERWNFKNIHKYLRNTDLKVSKNRPMKKMRQEWQLNLQELVEYKDVLAPIILEEWESNIGVGEKPGISSEQKVNAWLDSLNVASHSPPYHNGLPSWGQ